MLDAGNVVFPVSYIIGDVLTEVWGFRAARRVIWTGFVCNLLAALAIQAAIHAAAGRLLGRPGGVRDDPRLLDAAAGCLVLRLPGRRVHQLGDHGQDEGATEGRWLWTRTISSTVVAEALDSTVFVTIAFAGTGVPLLNTISTNWVFKTAYEIVATPLTYLVVGYLKRTEGVDVYDRDTPLVPIEIRPVADAGGSSPTGQVVVRRLGVALAGALAQVVEVGQALHAVLAHGSPAGRSLISRTRPRLVGELRRGRAPQGVDVAVGRCAHGRYGQY